MSSQAISLYFQSGGSDKVYHVQLEAREEGYVVNFQFGRRNGTLNSGTKTAAPVSFDKARKIYDALVKEKTSKGYVAEEGAQAFTGMEHAGRISGVQPQLSNAIDEATARVLLADPDWFAQEKMDGERRPVRFADGVPVGVNKKGLTVALPMTTLVALQQLLPNTAGTTLDAEMIGEVLHVFDALEWQGTDLRDSTLASRLERLQTLGSNALVKIVPTARSSAEKVALFERVRAANGEGLVFKRAGAKYVAGRPHSGGDSRKFKFIAEATVRVARVNQGKRSVLMELHDEAGAWSEVGSVTIPPAVTIPAPGSCIEVAYLHAFPGGSLFQPVYKGLREDQDEGDCVLAQLKFKQA